MTYVVALIPARSGSSLKDKNIRSLGGYPLLAYSIKAAQKAGNIDRVIVSTDSKDYAAIARDYGAETPFIQPENTARDYSGDYPFLAHSIVWMDANEKRIPDAIVHLRPTTPLRDPLLVRNAIDTLNHWGEFVPSALRSVHEMSESAHKCFHVIRGQLATLSDSFSVEDANHPRQHYKPTYQGNGYVDVLRTDFIRNTGKIHGSRVIAFITPPMIEVDTEDDFKMLELQIAANPQLVERLFR